MTGDAKKEYSDKDNSILSSDYTPPGQFSGALKQAQGAVYQAVGAVSSDPSWKEEGEKLSKDGQEERTNANYLQKGDATVESWKAKGNSALGYITGDQQKMSDANVAHEKAEWEYQAADGKIPVPSVERMKGKVESGVGMLTGDIEKQKSGNVRAQKAAITDG